MSKIAWDSLAVKQAKLIIIIATLIGVTLNAAQIYLDFDSESAHIERHVISMIDANSVPAARIAYDLDEMLANELIQGILINKWVRHAVIVDDLNMVLAESKVELKKSNNSVLKNIFEFVFELNEVYLKTLRINDEKHEVVGQLIITVDKFSVFEAFIKRSIRIVLGGIVKSIILGVFLLLVFYRHLTLPLIRISKLTENSTVYGSKKDIIPENYGHKNDEFSVLVASINKLIEISNEYSENLKNEVIKRTKELEDERNKALKISKERSILIACTIEKIEDERKNISSAIHDDLNPLILVCKMQLESCVHELNNNQLKNNLRDSLTEIQKNIQSSYNVARNISKGIRTEIIESLGIEDAVKELIEKYTRPKYIKIELAFDSQLNGKLLKEEELIVYRIINEGLSNAIKHSKANKILIFIELIKSNNLNQLRLIIKDDGVGFSLNEISSGIGIILMNENAEKAGSTLNIDSEKKKGTSITLMMPISY